jgi:uncharacterized protein (TIGR01777 family)
LISASAIGYYPTNSPDVATEFSFKGEGFLSDLCFRWEQEALNSQDRVAIIRTGVVLSQKGGALKKMLLPFYLGLGGVIGNGSQYMSWIHLDDIVNLYFEALINSQYTGVINATTSNPISNFTFTKALGKSINRPTIFPIPTIIIKTLFGEMGSIILDSQKVISDRLEDLGFKFKYPKIEDALNHIIKEKT